jgi:hypothetical protein
LSDSDLLPSPGQVELSRVFSARGICAAGLALHWTCVDVDEPSTPQLQTSSLNGSTIPTGPHRKVIDSIMLYPSFYVPRPYQNEPSGPRAMELYEIRRSINEVDTLHRARRKQRRAKWLRRPDLKRSR